MKILLFILLISSAFLNCSSDDDQNRSTIIPVDSLPQIIEHNNIKAMKTFENQLLRLPPDQQKKIAEELMDYRIDNLISKTEHDKIYEIFQRIKKHLNKEFF